MRTQCLKLFLFVELLRVLLLLVLLLVLHLLDDLGQMAMSASHPPPSSSPRNAVDLRECRILALQAVHVLQLLLLATCRLVCDETPSPRLHNGADACAFQIRIFVSSLPDSTKRPSAEKLTQKILCMRRVWYLSSFPATSPTPPATSHCEHPRCGACGRNSLRRTRVQCCCRRRPARRPRDRDASSAAATGSACRTCTDCSPRSPDSQQPPTPTTVKFIGSRGFHAMSFDTMLICTLRRMDDARMS